jgi:homoserine kinase
MEKSIKVFAPASVSNVGPGFDLMGFAINNLGDEIIVKINSTKKLTITKITGDKKILPLDVNKNTATVGISALLNFIKSDIGFDIEIHKKMGIGSGLGSSAASAVAGVYAVNKILDLNFSREELVEFAMTGEKAASGSFHADNVAPSMIGGFVLIRSYNPLDIIKVSTPKNIFISIIYPQITIKTSEARKLISKNIALRKSLNQTGNASALMIGMMNADFDLIGRAMIDEIAEPKRAALIPCYDRIRTNALIEGAINCNISGSGPAMFSFSKSVKSAERICSSMIAACDAKNIKSDAYVSKINNKGVIELA